MIRKHRWFWVLLFVAVVLLVVGLAAGWNVVLVTQYYEALELARRLKVPVSDLPWTSLILGSLGFAAVVAALVLFFVRLLHEMKLNQSQSEFLAAVSHELKTPIATLELTSNLLQAGGGSPEENERLWAGHQAELKRLREEVEALLEAARWQSGAVATHRGPIRLEEWLTQNLPRWNLLLGQGSRLRREGDRLERQALLDPKTLRLITDNLIDNARKFSRATPEVTVRSRLFEKRGKEYWEISIEDKGWGFEPSDAGRIFKRFYRSRSDAPYAIPGTGLGLFLAANASHALRVKIRGRSPGRGKGAVFTLSGKCLPASPEAPGARDA